MEGLLAWISRTMFVERLFGVLAYVLLTVLVYVLLRTAKGPRFVSRTLNVAVVVLGLMAFFFIPDESKDLYRWLEIGESWRGMPLSEFYTAHLSSSVTPVAYLMIYVSANTYIDGVLPMMAAVIFYVNVFHILKDLSRRQTLSNTAVALSFLFFMATGSFLEVISGVRCFAALAITARCIYDDTAGEKSFLSRVPLYIIACLIHSSAVPVLLVRLIVFLFFEKKNTLFQMILRVGVLLAFLVLIATNGQAIFLNMFEKADQYLFGDDRYTYVWEYMIGILQWFAMAYTVFFLRGEYREASKGTKRLQTMLLIFLAINLVFIVEYNLFHRFLVVSAILFLPYLAGLQYRNIPKYRALHQRLFWISVLIFLIVGVRGNLCGYKFMLL